jgi:hypothetical protein
MYNPKYFAAYELLPEQNYAELAQHIPHIFDDRILRLADFIREEIARPAYINTWAISKAKEVFGYLQYAGYRPFDCPDGADMSQHKFGRALDIKFMYLSDLPYRRRVEEYNAIRDWLTTNQENFPVLRDCLRCLEYDIDWLHIDCRNYKATSYPSIYKIYP